MELERIFFFFFNLSGFGGKFAPNWMEFVETNLDGFWVKVMA